MPNKLHTTNPAARAREVSEVTGGVDTHAEVHVAAALDQIGGLLGSASFPVSATGYAALLAWLRGFGPLGRVGVEGTGSYGAGLTRHLHAEAVEVVEVARPNRAERRNRGKSDTLDAENAARAVLAGTTTAIPKTRDGLVEAIRVLHTTRAGAVRARTAALNQFNGLLVAAPEVVAERLRGLSRTRQVGAASAFRPGDLTDPAHATRRALRNLARRIQDLTAEITATTNDLRRLTQQAAPELVEQSGVGPDTAAQLLITLGDHPERVATPAAFAALCGVSPVPASSGKTVRHRLSRGGDRQANRALHIIVLSRLKTDPQTRAYLERTTARGKTKREAIRLLKRYLARHIHRILTHTTAPTAPALAA